MALWVLLATCVVSGLTVAWGLFRHTAAVVKQKPNLQGILFKFLGIGIFLWAISEGRQNLVSLILTFFISLGVFLVLLTLARDKLLR
ncbi:MAG: hypothetical protein RI932_849 [Pseudomonadota bacterium]|jgi:hypothetical protein